MGSKESNPGNASGYWSADEVKFFQAACRRVGLPDTGTAYASLYLIGKQFAGVGGEPKPRHIGSILDILADGIRYSIQLNVPNYKPHDRRGRPSHTPVLSETDCKLAQMFVLSLPSRSTSYTTTELRQAVRVWERANLIQTAAPGVNYRRIKLIVEKYRIATDPFVLALETQVKLDVASLMRRTSLARAVLEYGDG